jgi:hypothetical protein
MLLLLHLLLHSFYSTFAPLAPLYCSVPLTRPIALVFFVVSLLLLNLLLLLLDLPLLLFDLLLCSSYSTNFTFLARPIAPLLLLDLLLLLLDLLLCSFCSTYFAPLAQPTLLFLLNLFTQIPLCYAYDFVFPFLLFDLFTQVSSFLCLGFVVPCSSCLTLLFSSFCFKLTLPPPLLFLHVWSVEELSKFEFFKFEFFRPNLEGEIFCVQFLFVEFF